MKGCGKSMIVLLLILLAAVCSDYRQGKIPNWIIIFGFISGVILRLLHGGIQGLFDGISGAVILGIMVYPVFKIGGLGGGDVKLFVVIGCYLGIKGGITSFIFAFVFGAIFSLVKMLRFHNFKERIYYFSSYMADIIFTGKWKLYEESLSLFSDKENTGEKSLKFPNYKIHFALPIFLGVVIYMGVVI